MTLLSEQIYTVRYSVELRVRVWQHLEMDRTRLSLPCLWLRDNIGVRQ